MACSGCGVLRNGKTSQFGSEAKDSRARDQGTTLCEGPGGCSERSSVAAGTEIAVFGLLHPVKTDRSHGPQGMVGISCFFWVVQCCAWTVPPSGSMATPSAMGAPVELSCSAAQCFQGQGESPKAQVAARQRSAGQTRRSASRVERLEKAVAVLGEGDSCGTGPLSGSPSGGMPSIHSTFAEVVATFAGRAGERTATVGHRVGAHGNREEMTRTTGPATVASNHGVEQILDVPCRYRRSCQQAETSGADGQTHSLFQESSSVALQTSTDLKEFEMVISVR